ncbi:XAP-5-like protein [Trichosporon asahii var. asahii CBS 2479]|uniref:XAP-5-like protein n=1 Tax=Trichosporon asahii var. asahii (strain ATCC 90039 / CBS 2479 / JCM 2466 / KCTC 7840 / NBRC 103889/ NCYC 2677 / UAMH 7654) TaxID=1186058 RepID=J6EZC1_TRIAS|nr:XAP-5-like protein [Trichosporon asahii var. asahii CBS 2479]EJT49994.1 XAP-5-like protein [Trichosporon asahii var. asahii CBS 2479]
MMPGTETREEVDSKRENNNVTVSSAQPIQLTVQKSQDDASGTRFVGVDESVDEQLKKSTIGLVSLEDFQKTKEGIEEEKRKQAAKTAQEKHSTAGKKSKKDKRKAKSKLSFLGDDEEGETEASEPESKRPKLSKNPNVDTSFLPDREREAQEREMREELRKNWLAEQERIKNEVIEITYSYWDGSGHRKVVECKKGDDIGAFLGKCRNQVPELRGTSVDNLMYIKVSFFNSMSADWQEDLIIPHHYTFYDFIINKARGKSGPLFNFDVHDDVRLISDATKEKDESHAGKVVEPDPRSFPLRDGRCTTRIKTTVPT